MFAVLIFAPHSATANPRGLTAAQQKLVNYCVSVISHGRPPYDNYVVPSQRFLAKMSRRKLREKLEPCLAILKQKRNQITSGHAFAVSYVLALRGIEVRKNFDYMIQGGGIDESTPDLLENVYRRHPSDFVLRTILNQNYDGAGATALRGTYLSLFRDYPTAFLRVSRIGNLDHLLHAVAEFEGRRERKKSLRHMRRLSHHYNATIANNARYCLKHYPKPTGIDDDY